jgi:hypothetical protein
MDMYQQGVEHQGALEIGGSFRQHITPMRWRESLLLSSWVSSTDRILAFGLTASGFTTDAESCNLPSALDHVDPRGLAT